VRDGKSTRFADKRVRQAMTMLSDRQRICEDIMLGLATPATGPFNRLGKQCNPEVKAWPFDVNAAKEKLKEAGYTDDGSGTLKGSDGQPFSFRLTYPSGSPSYDQMVLFLKDSYARAGITMEPDRLDWSVFRERMRDRNFDAISLGWSAGLEDDIYQMFDSSQIADGGDDFMSYKNPQLDQLIEQARETLDESKRIPLWRQCHSILHEDQPYTFLYTMKTVTFLDKRIQNVQQIPLGLNDATEWFVPTKLQKWK
jgi:peptide/nickel transport system substrate-binding protein